MRRTLLDASQNAQLRRHLVDALATDGVRPVHVHALEDERFAPCKGCFECWVRTPGRCTTRDAANAVMADIIDSDELVWVTRPRFGAWDPLAKAALDRTIGLLSPFFQDIDGEIHHHQRYDRYPAWGVLALEDRRTTPAERERFERLVARNTLNTFAGTPWVAWIREDASRIEIQAAIARARRHAESQPEATPAEPPTPVDDAVGVSLLDDRPRRALLLVGSAKPAGTSLSEALGTTLLDGLRVRGWGVDTVYVRSVARMGRDVKPRLHQAVTHCDLLILAAPVYVDCLPALVLQSLSALVQEGSLAATAVLPIVQSGFPELGHTTLALEVLADAVARGGGRWVGHLATGAGPELHGVDLHKPGARPQVQALHSAIDELNRGTALSADTMEQFAKSVLPAAAYRTVGGLSWIAQAWESGTVPRLWDRPFEPRPHT